MTGTKQAIIDWIDVFVNSNEGYSQHLTRRWSFLNRVLRQIIRNKDADCSASTLGIVWLAGYDVPVGPEHTAYTGNIKALLEAADWRSEPFENLAQTAGKVCVVIAPYHHVVISNGKLWLSAEVDENGHAIGGQPGNQGDKVGLRKPYIRGGSGWSWVLFPPEDDEVTLPIAPVEVEVPQIDIPLKKAKKKNMSTFYKVEGKPEVYLSDNITARWVQTTDELQALAALSYEEQSSIELPKFGNMGVVDVAGIPVRVVGDISIIGVILKAD